MILQIERNSHLQATAILWVLWINR